MIYERENRKNNPYYYSAAAFGDGTDYHFILTKPSIFRDGTDYAVALVFLGLFPVLVYPIWAAVPKLKEKGREGQRNLAFIGTLIGYIGK